VPAYDLAESPDAALRCILRRCDVPVVRLAPQDLRAVPAGFYRDRQAGSFCYLPFVSCRFMGMDFKSVPLFHFCVESHALPRLRRHLPLVQVFYGIVRSQKERDFSTS
jgi:hypothetical protein